MSLIGSLSEQHEREQLIASNLSLRTGESPLAKVLQARGVNLATYLPGARTYPGSAYDPQRGRAYVFGGNDVARGLYRSLGFREVAVWMTKEV